MRKMSGSPTLSVIWTRAELLVVLEAVRASAEGRGRTPALRELERAERRLVSNGKKSVTVYFGEMSLGHVATVLNESDSHSAHRALKKLESVVLAYVKSRRPSGKSTQLTPGAPADARGGVGLVKAGGPRKVGDSAAVYRRRRPWKS